MSVQKSQPPKAIRGSQVEARVLRQKIWRRCNVMNEHFMAAIVGREGSGKSITGLSIMEKVDPSFHAGRVMFDPKPFLERLKEWKEAGETQGKMVVIDEAGVGVGVRSWYEKDQILFNQVLQVIRDENMGVLFTLPRLGELDSMAKGRLHALLEMQDKENGEWAELKWKNMDPDRIDETGKMYKPFPRMRVNGHQRRVTRLRFSPPSDGLIEAYETRKEEFQAELYDDAIDEMSDEEEEEQTAQEIADTIVDEGQIQNVLSYHGGHNKWQIDKELIREMYDTTHSKARTIKKLLANDSSVDVERAGQQREAEA